MMRAAMGTFGVALLLACASARTQSSDVPSLERLSPDSVLVAPGSVVEVTLIGSGFRRGRTGENTVRFGTSTMRGVHANDDGTRIVFVVPDAIDSGGEAPPVRLIAGSYAVRVETSSGASNTLMLRVFR